MRHSKFAGLAIHPLTASLFRLSSNPPAGDALDEDFAEDRGRLFLDGDNWASNLKKANKQLPHLVTQLRVHLPWLEDMLSDDRKYLLCDEPSVFDAQMYHVIWFIRGRFAGGDTLLAEFPNLVRWDKTQNHLVIEHQHRYQ